MAILNVQVETVGQAAQVPKFVYINTNDTAMDVVVPGYLNDIVSQGILVSETDMALVVTKSSPNSRSSQTSLYEISFSAGLWSLVSASGGFSPSQDQTITGNWNFVGPFSVSAGSGDVLLQSDTGDIAILAPNAGSTIDIQADTLDITAPTAFNINSSSINAPLLAHSTAPNVVYYHTGSGLLSYGTSPAFNPNSNYTLTGDITFTGPVNFNSTTDDVNFDMPNNQFGFSGSYFFVFTNSVNGIAFETSGGGIYLTCDNNDVINLQSNQISLPAIPLNPTTQLLYYDSGTHLVSYGDASSSFDQSANYTTLSGMWNYTDTSNVSFNGVFNVTSSVADVFIQSSTAVILQASGSSSASLTSVSGDAIISGGDSCSITATANSVTISAGTDVIINAAGNLGIVGGLGLDPGGSAIVMWNPGTRQFYHA